MYGVPIRTSRITTGVAVALLGLLILATGWRYARSSWLTVSAYTAARESVRRVSAQQESLQFSVLGLDEAATCHSGKDGDYVATGWAEQTNVNGRREHRDWKAIVHHNSGTNWSCVYLKLDQYVVGTDTGE
jgi:hypothetical protein